MTTPDTRHPTRDTRRSTFGVRRSVFNVRRFFSRLRASAPSREPSAGSAFSVGRWAFDFRRSPTLHFFFLTLPSGGRVRRSAFTLVEMLIVISIISVLLGLLYGALERARTFSRRAVTYTEVKNIEAAFKQYYAHYHDWPPAAFINAATHLSPAPTGDDNGFIIDANAEKVLQGTLSDSDTQVLRDANPDRIPFIEFARKNSLGAPINPFRLLSGAQETRQYKVLFDLDNDSKIEVVESTTNVTVYASVAVWTVIPGTSSSGQNNGTATVVDEVLGSWDTFNAK